MQLRIAVLAAALLGVQAGFLPWSSSPHPREASKPADIGCGETISNHADYDAARIELASICGTGPLPSHQNLFRRHGSVVAFLCSYGDGGNPGDFPKEANKTCVTPITGACGAYKAGWVIAPFLNITYGIDVANTTICNNKHYT